MLDHVRGCVWLGYSVNMGSGTQSREGGILTQTPSTHLLGPCVWVFVWGGVFSHVVSVPPTLSPKAVTPPTLSQISQALWECKTESRTQGEIQSESHHPYQNHNKPLFSCP